MIAIAQDMGMEKLKMECEDYVISTMKVDNACTFLTAVMDIQEKNLGEYKNTRELDISVTN